MGKRLSKHSKKNNKSEGARLHTTAPNVPEQEQYEIYDPGKYDLEAVEDLRKKFRDDPEMFILNMLLMSFMFFDDYQEEMRRLAYTSSESEKSLNSQLIKNHQKERLMPDSVLDSVNKRVKYRHTRGPKKGLLEPITSQRMFVLHHMIEIEDDNYTADYSSIDKPPYSAEIEESKDNRGFVKVLLGNARKHSSDSENRPPSADSACSTSSTKIYRRKSEIVLPNKLDQEDCSPTGAQGNDSGFSGGNSESSYGYSKITAARTPRKLYISEKDMYTNISQLPSKCITPIQVRNVEDLWDSDDEEDQKYKKPKREVNLFRTNYYLNSTAFMSHFKNNIFPNYLGEIMGFTREAIDRAMSIPGAIYCDTKDDIRNIVQWEVIPVIPLSWPDKIAFEWTLRRRRTVWDKREKKPIAYKWPTPKMVEEANKLDCVVVPRGFMPKKGENSSMDIEWEVGFPKAERYLEFRMSYAQMRIFLYIIILHKKFIEPRTKKHGLTVEHIRNLMLWECEANYKAWPEDKLGTKLKLVLKNLYESMSKAELAHYFIKSRNVFENVPRMYLNPAQDTINCILETPLPYVLSALQHLKYMSPKLYPEPDLDKLYRIMTSHSVLHHEAQLTIAAFEKAKQQEEAKRRKEEDSKRSRDRGQEWNRRYLETQKNLHKKNLMTNNVGQSRNLKTERRDSTESIKLDFSVKKRFAGDVARQIKLLTFFFHQFLQIAKRCLKISTTTQTTFYLKQAWYLTMLLEDIDPENALQFQKQIKDEEELCLKKQVTEPKIPSTPKRNSTMFGSDILQVKGRDINIANLSKSFNANVLPNEPMPSTSGVKKKTKFQQNLKEDPLSAQQNQIEASKGRDVNKSNLSNSYIRNQAIPSTSGIKTMTKAKKVHLEESEAEYKYNQNSLYEEDESVELRQHNPEKRLAKSVSFRTQGRGIDISPSDDEAESTSL